MALIWLRGRDVETSKRALPCALCEWRPGMIRDVRSVRIVLGPRIIVLGTL